MCDGCDVSAPLRLCGQFLVGRPTASELVDEGRGRRVVRSLRSGAVEFLQLLVDRQALFTDFLLDLLGIARPADLAET